MQVYLGLGSNVGDRRKHVRRSIELLQQKGLRILRLSPIVESPALLPKLAPSGWNLPFLNLVLEGQAKGSPQQWRRWIEDIQRSLNGADLARWSPRSIDIDILLWGQEIIATEGLTIPHVELHKRNFVLTPLVYLQPDLTIPGLAPKTVLERSRELPHHIPLWMGILNITPDSFSDGGHYTQWDTIGPHLEQMLAAGVHIIDTGAESTRPKAMPVAPEEEWLRLQPILKHLRDEYQGAVLRPLLSVDTRHPEVAEKALDWGADIINDVSGLTSPEMMALAKASGKQWVAMHHLTIPANSQHTLPTDRDPCDEVEKWLSQRLEAWTRAGLDLNKIIFDPGVGFGKNSLQSLELMRHVTRFRKHGLRVLVGHSRKSFMKTFADAAASDRDLETIGASLKLCQKGVDIVRVHDVPGHMAAYRGWSHLEN